MSLRRLLRYASIGASILLAGVVLALAWAWWTGNLVRTVYYDADGNRLEGENARVRQVLWSPPTALSPASISPDSADVASRLYGSDRLLVLSERNEHGDRDLYFCVRTETGWSQAQPFPDPINTSSNEISPALSRDGDRLYFASDRPGSLGGLDLWVAVRVDGAWTRPRNLGPAINSPWDDDAPAPHPYARLLVFSTNRPRGFIVTPPEDWRSVPVERWEPGEPSLAMATAEERAGKLIWSRPAHLPELSSTGSDDHPAFSPDGRLLYFTSSRPGGVGGLDLWRSRVVRPTAGDLGSDDEIRLVLEKPEPLGATINTPEDERAPRIFDRGFALVCERRTRIGGDPLLLESRTVEVEKDLELAELPVEALAARAGQILLLFTSFAALVVATVVLWRSRRRWTADLLVRSGVLAVVAHIGLLYAFYFWKVTAEIIAFATQEPELEISLESSAAASIALEVRRQVLDVPEPDAASPTADRQSAVSPDDILLPRPPSSRSVRAEGSSPPILPSGLEIATAEPAASDVRGLIADAQRVDASSSAASSVALAEAARESPTPADDGAAAPESSLRVDIDLTRATVAQSAKVLAPSPDSIASEELVIEVATSPAVSTEPSPLLPSHARASPRPAPVAALPVPAQSPREESAPASSEPRPAPASSQDESTAVEVALAATGPSTATRVPLPQGSWDALSSAIDPTIRSDAPEALPETPMPVAHRVEPIARARHELPEPIPIAERTARGGEGEEFPRPIATASAQREITDGTLAPATLRSEAVTTEVAPLAATAELAAAIEPGALARPDTEATPGALRPAAARIEPIDPSPRASLPERTGGGERAADVVATAPLEPASSGRAAAFPATTAATEPLANPPARVAFADPLEPTGPRATAAVPATSRSPLAPDPLSRRAPASAPTPLAELLSPPELESVRADPALTRAELIASLHLPETADGEKPAPRLIDLRRPENRQKLLERMGGTAASEAAVVRALEWLAREQHADGRWSSLSGGGLMPDVDSGVTGLVILCFLGHGHVPGTNDRYAPDVARAIDWLLSQADANGLLSGRDRTHTMYTHAIATLALSEAFLLTNDRRLYEPLERAAKVFARAQNPKTGGWRYAPEPPRIGDTSSTGWQVLALVSLRSAGIEVPEEVFERARHWFDVEAGGGRQGGIYGYQGRDEPRVAMAAEGLYARLLLGAERGFPPIEEAARYLYAETRDGSHLHNLYLLYYGTLGLFQYQGWIWEAWNSQVREHLIKKQRDDGRFAGSWDPGDEYVAQGGRVLATAFATLTLEVYYRYLPLYWGKD